VLLWTVAATATSRVRLNASTLSTFYYEPPHLARVTVLTPGQVATPIQEQLFDEETKAQFEALIPRGKMGTEARKSATVAIVISSDAEATNRFRKFGLASNEYLLEKQGR
jgi:NAD(P)-dependent dehydrogenase (short-subunit alcohol dehydrogenase family)